MCWPTYTAVMSDAALTLGYLVADLHRLYVRQFDRMAAPHGLTHVQWRILKRLHDGQGVTPADLASGMEMEPVAVGRVLMRLQKAGLVHRQQDPDERGCWRLYVTPASLPVIAQIDALATGLRGQILGETDPGELDRVVAVLARLHDNLAGFASLQRA